MTFDTILTEQTVPLTRRLTRMVGDVQTAEDLCQETFARAVAGAPAGAPAPVLRAWLHRTGRNLALDELRRRRRRDHVPLHAELASPAAHPEPDGPRAALARLTPHQRLVLLLRFEAGLSLREIGDLLDIGEDAARKRVARARAAFADVHAALSGDDTRPTVLLLLGHEDPGPYEAWLRAAGARVRTLDGTRAGLDLAGADALVLGGSERDIHPALYGHPAGPHLLGTDLTRHLRDLAALRAALAADLPVLGVCSGAQLLNVLHGGDLHQHLPAAGFDHLDHREAHGVRTLHGTLTHRILGGAPEVVSEHHQAVQRLGRGLRVTSVADDGLVEALEVPGRRFALGVQWHPERCASGAGAGLAEALLQAAA
ncbi:gamma-glutamyl-gamma-aminobutyrate hydrolase family protein [Baekduia soli]|nr:gamma-glutamyl-gamma-aminobutyrate hydrolase family protein [Baekduia soli]